MICKRCGQELQDGTKFCTYCGQNQGEEVKQSETSFKETAQNVGNAASEVARNVGSKASEVYIKSDALFTNIGDKLCKIAKIVFWVGAIVSVIAGIVVIFGAFNYLKYFRYYAGTFFITIIGGILGAALGVLLSWLGSLGLYAFGELVRRVQAIEERMR